MGLKPLETCMGETLKTYADLAVPSVQCFWILLWLLRYHIYRVFFLQALEISLKKKIHESYTHAICTCKLYDQGDII